jgi:aspartate aminotransferase-like enzyme
MCPPGLLIAAVGARAWRANEESQFARFFWDIADAKRMAEQGMTPTTPPLSLLFAFHAALGMIAAEGIEQVWVRHQAIGALTRAGLRSAGLDVFARAGYESNSVTAFRPPAGLAASEMLDILRRDFGIEAQGGQSHMAEQLVRIGHMGWVHESEVREAVGAIAEISRRYAATTNNATIHAENRLGIVPG